MRSNPSRLVLLLLGAALLLPAGVSAQEAVADSVRKYKFLGKTARDKGDHEDVIGYYTRLAEFDPDYHPAQYYIARANLALGQQEAAKAALLTAVDLRPDHDNTRLLLFQIYAGAAKADSAWLFLQPLVAAGADDAKVQDYHRTVADLYRRAGQDSVALLHYEQIVAAPGTTEEDRGELGELLAVLYDDMGNTAKALEWRQRLAGNGGAGQVESLSKMVDLQIRSKDYAAAFATLRQLARVDSSASYSHFVRMSELGDTANDPEIRLAGLEGMARVQPKDLATVATITEIHLNDVNLPAASRWLGRGLKQNPDDAHLRVLQGDLLRQQKAPEDDVIAEYEIALKDPNWAAVAQQRIWQIRPPETEEEKLRKEFFGGSAGGDGGS